MQKLNIGCGNDYKEGWINLDYNLRFKAEVYADINNPLPFRDNTFDYILASNIISYAKDSLKLIEEIYRISKPDAIIEILVPHFTGIHGRKYLEFHQEFGVGSFVLFKKESYNGHLIFEIIEERLCLFSKPNIIDYLFNLNRFWKILMERIFFIGFNSIRFKLRVKK